MERFSKLLIPLDGSRLAEAALPVTMLLARGFRATVSLLHVMERGAPETVHGERHLADAGEAERYLAEVAERFESEGIRAETHVHPNLESDVVGSIISHAREFGADMNIITTHGSGGMKSILVGSIAQQVLRRGSCPVLLVRPSTEVASTPFEIHNILVPLDGSPAHDEAVLPVAEDVAQAVGSGLKLLVVVPTLSTVSGDKAAVATLMPRATAAALDIEQEDAGDYLRHVAERLRGEGLRAEVTVRRGDTPQGVMEAASDGADMIVMSTHGRAGLGALWQASVGAKILARISQPLLLVRVEN